MTEKTLGEIFDAAFSENVNGRIKHFEDFSVDVRAAIEAGVQAAIEAYEARKWQPIETMPSDVYFLAENEHGDWIKVKRYVNPADSHGFYVVNRREGKWFTPCRWQHLPQPPGEL